MRTPVKAPPAAQLVQSVKAAVAALDAIEKSLGFSVTPMSGSDKRHTARFKKGGEKVVEVVGNMATQHDLESGALKVAPMKEQLATANALSPLVTRLSLFSGMVDEVVFAQKAAAWQTAMRFYAMLRRIARNDNTVAVGLKPVTQFMSMHDPRRKRKPRAAKKA